MLSLLINSEDLYCSQCKSADVVEHHTAVSSFCPSSVVCTIQRLTDQNPVEPNGTAGLNQSTDAT